MRGMNLPPFEQVIEISDFDHLLRTRLSNPIVMWPGQALPLLCYMCAPNDEGARNAILRILWSWAHHSGSGQPVLPRKLARIQTNWVRFADIFQRYCDLVAGQHEEARGGPSIGKAITLVEANATSWGTGAANLWKLWGTYKDVAHLVTAAALVCGETRKRILDRPLPANGLKVTQIIPFQMVLLMPDFVLAVAMELNVKALPALQVRARSRRLIPIRCGAYPPTSMSCRYDRRRGCSGRRTLTSSKTAALGTEDEPDVRLRQPARKKIWEHLRLSLFPERSLLAPSGHKLESGIGSKMMVLARDGRRELRRPPDR